VQDLLWTNRRYTPAALQSPGDLQCTFAVQFRRYFCFMLTRFISGVPTKWELNQQLNPITGSKSSVPFAERALHQKYAPHFYTTLVNQVLTEWKIAQGFSCLTMFFVISKTLIRTDDH
jgi:hypothetical protein